MRCVWPSHVPSAVGHSIVSKNNKKKKNNIFNLFSCSLIFVGSQNCHWFFIGLVIVANFYSSFDCFVNPQIVPSRYVWAFFWVDISIIFQSNRVIHICVRFVFILPILNHLGDIHKINLKTNLILPLIELWFSDGKPLPIDWNLFIYHSIHFLYSISIKSSARHIPIYRNNSIILKLPPGCHLINPSLYLYWN